MIPINQRKKKVPLPKPAIVAGVLAEVVAHHLRKTELSRIHGIPEKDKFVDPGNGVELYRTVSGGWVTNPINRGVE